MVIIAVIMTLATIFGKATLPCCEDKWIPCVKVAPPYVLRMPCEIKSS